MKIYKITVWDEATYEVGANDRMEAIQQAREWFKKRTIPSVKVHDSNEKEG